MSPGGGLSTQCPQCGEPVRSDDSVCAQCGRTAAIGWLPYTLGSIWIVIGWFSARTTMLLIAGSADLQMRVSIYMAVFTLGGAVWIVWHTKRGIRWLLATWRPRLFSDTEHLLALFVGVVTSYLFAAFWMGLSDLPPGSPETLLGTVVFALPVGLPVYFVVRRRYRWATTDYAERIRRAEERGKSDRDPT